MTYRVETDENGPCVITFDSVMDFTQDVYAAADKRERLTPWNSRTAQQVRLERNPKFTGCKTIADAQTLAARGLAAEGFETFAIAQDVIKELQQERQLPEFTAEYDVSGSEVDIERYLDGEPECMIEYPLDEILSTGPVVTLVVGMNYSAITTKDAILAQGKLAVALAMALAECGYSLEIWAEIHTGADTGQRLRRYPHGIKVKVKVLEAGTTIDPTALAYGLAHPSMLRIFGFSAMHLAPETHRDECRIGDSYGNPRLIDPNDYPDNAIILNPRSGIEATAETLRDDVMEHLTNLGILDGEQS